MINKLKFFNDINASTNVGVFGLTKSLQALYVLKTFDNVSANVLVVVDNNSNINELYNELVCFTDNVLTFPMDSVTISQVEAISPEFMQERFDTLVKLQSNSENYIVITCLEGFLHPLLNVNEYKSKTLSFKPGNTISDKNVIEFLTNNMYERVNVISQTGEFAFRGHVLDIFVEDIDNPIRIEFWGDEIDSIREFDIQTQRTIKQVDNVLLYPNPDCQLSDNTSTIADYVNGFNIVIDFETINQRYETLSFEKQFSNIFDTHIFSLDSDSQLVENKKYYKSSEIPFFNGNFRELEKFIAHKLAEKWLVVIALETENQVSDLREYFDFKSEVITSNKDFNYRSVNFILQRLSSSICFDDAKVCVIGSSEIYSKKLVKKRYTNKFKFTQRIRNANELNVGDFIVHELHGIGRYAGIIPIINNNITTDFFVIEYQGDDKLYVPIDQVDAIMKYSSNSEYEPRVHKLGGSEWEKTKRRISGRMEEIAKKLLEVYAKRENALGFACKEDSVDALVFENEFEFSETKDQLRAITEIKSDMEKQRPMDRLLCGDVGFGKTEVAFRAAFKAMDNNKQVAYLCPTTILSMQQYDEAIKRFVNVPINIALLNRYTSNSKRLEILSKLAEGKIDLIFGTHSLLSDKVKFKDLGLLVVDEEQRFGVEHKEKIKEHLSDVDVLTLSATPIPRTLQMSLLGIRDLSTIDTAPVNRFPVQTYVMRYDENVLKEAIFAEKSRGGQIFILCNAISKHNSIKRIVKKLDQDLLVESANGKMNRDDMEDVFFKFSNHEIDVLIATTIIESGINVPNANTLIILEADKFGLAQLYQIRGRVGRGSHIAYAYLMYDQNKILMPKAKKRLEAIKNFTSLGSGFKIASRDLAIRGAGDILGAEQAGFIDTIGVELYMKMLKRVIDGKSNIDNYANANTPLVKYSNHIPDEYVLDDDIKLQIHKRIQEIDSVSKYKTVKEEISDIYGKIPKEVCEYMNDVLFNVTVKESNIEKVVDEKRYVVVYLDSKRVDVAKLVETVRELGRTFRLLNKGDVIYLTIDKSMCDNWKAEILKYVYVYDKLRS